MNEAVTQSPTIMVPVASCLSFASMTLCAAIGKFVYFVPDLLYRVTGKLIASEFCFGVLRSFNELQFLNTFTALPLVTLLRSKFVRTSVLRLVQLKNMQLIIVKFAVLKLPRSRFVRLLQPANMANIFVTFDVSNLPRSRLVKLLQS